MLSRRAGVVTLLIVALTAACSPSPPKGIVIGETSTTQIATSGPRIILAPPTTLAEPPPGLEQESVFVPGGGLTGYGGGAGSMGVVPPDGVPYGPALPFPTDIVVPDDLVYVLVIGSDARAGEDPRVANADSIHIVAVNPSLGAGTIVGIPRDSWVDVPGWGRDKVNAALPVGGPDLMAETIRQLTGLPIHNYVLTGFAGFQGLVDEAGGLSVPVAHGMDDSESGARFQAGQHHFSGGEALAFARNRKDTAAGDFSRSENQGTLMLAALAKLRAETSDREGLRVSIGVLLRHVDLDMSPTRLDDLAVVARRLDPALVSNLVAPGTVGWAGAASVVYLTEAAAALFIDLRDDALVGTPPPPPDPTAAGAPPPDGAEPPATSADGGTAPPPSGSEPPPTTTTKSAQTTTTTSRPPATSTTTTFPTTTLIPPLPGGQG